MEGSNPSHTDFWNCQTVLVFGSSIARCASRKTSCAPWLWWKSFLILLSASKLSARTLVGSTHSVSLATSNRFTFTPALADPRAGSIDFSKATRLKEVEFNLTQIEVVWIAMALKTLTYKNRDLREILLHIFVESSPEDEPDNVREPIGDEVHKQWVDLDQVLVQLWESNAIHTKVIYPTRREEEETREYIGTLLPEMVRRGIVEMMDKHDYCWM